MSENVKPHTRDSYYDNLRFFLMFIVVLCHGLETMRASSVKIANLHEVLLSFCMPLFVFLTGFFAKNMAKADNPKRMRILNIMLLYAITQILKNEIAGYTSFLKPTYGNWFLIGMIAWYMILPLITKLKPAVVIAGSILAALLIGMDPYANTVLQTSRVACFFPFFMLGFYVSKEQAEILKNPKIRLCGFVILVAAIIFILTVWIDATPLAMMHAYRSYDQMKLTTLQGFTMRLGWYALATVVSFGIMCIIPRKHTPLTVFGTRTLPIFIIHTILYLYLSKRTGFFTWLGAIPSGYVRLTAVTLLTLVVTLVSGNKFFAYIFDQFMGYDFRHLMKRD